MKWFLGTHKPKILPIRCGHFQLIEYLIQWNYRLKRPLWLSRYSTISLHIIIISDCAGAVRALENITETGIPATFTIYMQIQYIYIKNKFKEK